MAPNEDEKRATPGPNPTPVGRQGPADTRRTSPADADDQADHTISVDLDAGEASPNRALTPELEIPPEIGKYQILRRLGRGGMSAVYLAIDTSLQRKVALKILRFVSKDDKTMLERFTREARIAASLQHPNLCHVYEVGTAKGLHYISMAFITGIPLSECTRAPALLPIREVVRLMGKICQAAFEAHRVGVVHRDIKPSNIIIDQRKEPILLDFGIAYKQAATTDNRLTVDGAILGTPAYISPEQIDSKFGKVGPASDIYSLGVVLYELLAGRVPYEGEIGAILVKVVSGEPPALSSLRPGIDPRLEKICLKAMSRRPTERYRSMQEFGAALDEYLRNFAEVKQSAAPDVPDLMPIPEEKVTRPEAPANPTPKPKIAADSMPVPVAKIVSSSSSRDKETGLRAASKTTLRMPPQRKTQSVAFRESDILALTGALVAGILAFVVVSVIVSNAVKNSVKLPPPDGEIEQAIDPIPVPPTPVAKSEPKTEQQAVDAPKQKPAETVKTRQIAAGEVILSDETDSIDYSLGRPPTKITVKFPRFESLAKKHFVTNEELAIDGKEVFQKGYPSPLSWGDDIEDEKLTEFQVTRDLPKIPTQFLKAGTSVDLIYRVDIVYPGMSKNNRFQEYSTQLSQKTTIHVKP